MDLLARMNRVAFLGPEFLSWLWYRTENQGPAFSVEGVEGALEIWFDDRLIVGSTLVNAQENHFKGGHPTTSLEARSALRLGKLATEARLRIVHGSREWSFILKGADLSLNGVKIPSVLSKDDEERLYERLYLLEELDRMVFGVFGQFLRLRGLDDWGRVELPAIRAWVGGHDFIAAPEASVSPRPIGSIEPTLRSDAPRDESLPPWEDPMGDPS